MNRRMATLTVAVFVFMLAGDAADASEAPRTETVLAARYEFSFVAGSDKLTSQAGLSKVLASTVDLLIQHGRRTEISFLIAGEVPLNCILARDCKEATLLRQRVLTLMQALRGAWPRLVDQQVLGNLSWRAQPPSLTPLDRDQLRLVLQKNAVAQRPICPGQIEVLDPGLPGTVTSPDTSVWVKAAGGQVIPVSAKARLRLVQGPQPAVAVWLEDSGKSKLLQAFHDPTLDQDVYSLNATDASFRVLLTSAEARMGNDTGGGIKNDVGDVVKPWSGTPTINLKPFADDTRCSFWFARWAR